MKNSNRSILPKSKNKTIFLPKSKNNTIFLQKNGPSFLPIKDRLKTPQIPCNVQRISQTNPGTLQTIAFSDPQGFHQEISQTNPGTLQAITPSDKQGFHQEISQTNPGTLQTINSSDTQGLQGESRPAVSPLILPCPVILPVRSPVILPASSPLILPAPSPLTLPVPSPLILPPNEASAVNTPGGKILFIPLLTYFLHNHLVVAVEVIHFRGLMQSFI